MGFIVSPVGSFNLLSSIGRNQWFEVLDPRAALWFQSLLSSIGRINRTTKLESREFVSISLEFPSAEPPGLAASRHGRFNLWSSIGRINWRFEETLAVNDFVFS